MLRKLENYNYIELSLTLKQATALSEWAAALRSGKYTQVRDVLLLPDKTSGCCHGIACAINPEFPFEWVETYIGSEGSAPSGTVCLRWFDEDRSEEGSTLMPPVNWMIRVYGISSVSAGNLATLNDSGATFEEIAQLLEEHRIPYLSGKQMTLDFLAAARSNG